MVIEELIHIISTDTELREMLKATPRNNKISPNFAIKDGIAYTFADIANDRIKVQASFQLTIVNEDLFTAYKIKERLDKLLLTFGDNQLTKNILSVVQNGGGSYFDADLQIQKVKANYTVLYKI